MTEHNDSPLGALAREIVVNLENERQLDPNDPSVNLAMLRRDFRHTATLPEVLRALADLCDAGLITFDKEGWFDLPEVAGS